MLNKNNNNMKNKKLTLVCALTLSIIGCSYSINAHASTSKIDNYNVKKAHQPYMKGFWADDLLNWSPGKYDTDFFIAKENINNRDIKDKNDFNDPKDNRKNKDVKVLSLSNDYGEPRDKSGKCLGVSDFLTNISSFERNNFKFWQYIDIYGDWNGTIRPGVDYNKFKNTQSDQYGVINYPNPDYTNAAHKNGVISLGGWFWPRKDNFDKWVQQRPDGSYPIGDKMIELAKYLNFDGYFINQEGEISQKNASKLKGLLSYIKQKSPNLYLCFYDSILKDGTVDYQNSFNNNNYYWMKDDKGNKILDSIFINYAWNKKRLTNASEFAKKNNIIPTDNLFAGTESQNYLYNPPYKIDYIFNKNNGPLTSWGLFGTDSVFSRNPNGNVLEKDQKNIEKRERQYWSGYKENPMYTGIKTKKGSAPYKDPGWEKVKSLDVNNPKHWPGVANYIPSKTVIHGKSFYTNFDTGHGKHWFINGKKNTDNRYSDLSRQSILPTWQFWKTDKNDNIKVDYDYNQAYNGGASLKINGKTNKNIKLNLYKTDLTLDDNSIIETHIKGKNTKMYLLLLMNDNTVIKKRLNFNNKWSTNKIKLKDLKNHNIKRISFEFGSIRGKQINANIGDIKIGSDDKLTNMSIDKNIKIDKIFTNSKYNEAYVLLNFENNKIKHYDVFNDKNIFVQRLSYSKSYIYNIPKNKMIVKAVNDSNEIMGETTINLK